MGEELDRQAQAARAEVINVVNNFFYDKLTALPNLKSYIECHQQEPEETCVLVELMPQGKE
jgi:hypothetical protein